MQDHRADIYILTWTRQTAGNGPSFQTFFVSYDYGKTIKVTLKNNRKVAAGALIIIF